MTASSHDEAFPSLSVVIPAFNEELFIERTVATLEAALEGRVADYEIWDTMSSRAKPG